MTDRDRKTAAQLVLRIIDPGITPLELGDAIAEVIATARREGAADAQAEIARLRAVLRWAVYGSDVDEDVPAVCDAAMRSDWPAVRAAGVALGEGE